ncbi:ABC-type dipeptide transport system, periplasmic componen [Corynebacterium ramonii]|uniref:ABC-type dipeptide transport system, periplasmic componen n=2 Tax=Corynebacteriaceae TaxID=1653 RepID=A0ABM5RT78_9CORY|nr:ABC-type dipeptide transport system, periplasmic componen [Corynebacterium ramonii FRC0011]STC83302.1 dipeptide ABC transporter substrate-binding protein [Corynebacterium ulcerans]
MHSRVSLLVMFSFPRRAVAMMTLAIFGLSACSAGSTASQNSLVHESNDHSVTLGLTAPPSSLDFTTTSGAAIPQALMGNVYEGLVRVNQNGEVEPLLASSWEVSEDGTQYVFHLREGVRFSNGDAFTADTAKFSIDRVLSDAWTNGLKAQMSKVTNTRVIDTHTLEVTLAHRSNTWLWSMGTLIGAMMSPRGVSDLATKPVGTGPYEVDNWAVGTSLSFTSRGEYWGESPKNKRAVLRYFADAISLTNAVRSGDVDAVIGLQSPELLESIQRDGDLNINVGTTNGEVLLTMNHARAPFNDLRVRQAVMFGVDRQAIIDTTWEGYGIDTGGAPVPPTDPWYQKAEQYPFDPDRARQLMDEAGATGTKITISVPSLPYAATASEILYSQLRDIGFDVSIESTEFPSVWLAKVYKGHDYDMSVIAHTEARDIPNIFANPKYYLGYDDKKVQELIAQADTVDEADYVPTMKKAVTRILDQAAADNLFNLPNIVVTAKNVSGVPVNAVGDGLLLAAIAKEEPRKVTH